MTLMAQGYEVKYVFVPEPLIGLVMHLQSCVAAGPPEQSAQLTFVVVDSQSGLPFQMPLWGLNVGICLAIHVWRIALWNPENAEPS